MSVPLPSAALVLSKAQGPSLRSASIADLLLRAAQQHPLSGLRLVSGERVGESVLLTYPALLDQAQRILGGLRRYGHPPGAKVALVLERAADLIPAFWACVLGGYVPCPLVAIRNDAERWAKHLAYICTLLDRPLLVTTRALKTELPNVIAADLEILRRSSPYELVYEAEPEDPAVLALTSGSTDDSKAVVLTHGNLLASMAGKTERQKLAAADITLNWISFDHVDALLEAHMLPLYVGATQLHVKTAAILADPLLFLRIIDRYRVSMAFVPSLLFGQMNAAVQSMGSEGYEVERLALDLSCLRHIISSREADGVETGRRFLELFAPYGLGRSVLWPAFGMTETCAGSIYSREFPDCDAEGEFASVGVPVTGLEMRIADDDGAPAPPGESGELQLRGPMVFTRYHNDEEATRAAFTPDGWFRTGDLGRIEDGRLSLVGRSQDSIIVSGANYFSHELETVLEQLDGIERSFVAAFPIRPKGVDTEQLAITFASTFPLEDEARLQQLVVAIRNNTILLWGLRPAAILPLPKDAFPKTSLGKIQRAMLRKRLEGGGLAAHEAYVAAVTSRQLGGHAPPEGPAERAIAGIFGEMLGLDPATVSRTASFFDLGGTSLDILKLKRKLGQRLGIADLPIITILRNPTVRGLAEQSTPGRLQEKRDYDPIIPLQLSGSKTPLFCVHPDVGDVLVFVNLAKYFVNERPCYALRARGFDEGEKYFSTFAEMVGTYVEAIRRRQPHGPYAVAGYSYGGAVAFEIAKVLESQGERVAFLGSFNLPPHIKSRMDELDEVEGAVNLALFLGLLDQKQADELPKQLRAALPVQDPCAYLIQVAPRERLAELDLDLPKFKAWARLAQSLLTLGRSYIPSGKAESMTVFCAIPPRGTKKDWLNKELKRWDDFTRAPNRYIDVAGEHHTLMGPKHVSTFQAALRAELDRALAGH